MLRQYAEFETLMEGIPFFEGLSLAVGSEFFERAFSRSFGRGEQLRGINTSGSMVHLILDGYVLERTTFAESPQSSTVRFFGRGTLIGITDIFLEDPQPAVVECLQRTWTFSYPLDRIRALADADVTVMRNLAQTMALQLRTIERVYAPSRKSSAQRVAALLLELADISTPGQRLMEYPEPDEERNTVVAVIEGPTQADIADALMLSMASVENVYRGLRQVNIITTEYREVTIHDVKKLKEVASGTLTVESAYKPKKTSIR